MRVEQVARVLREAATAVNDAQIPEALRSSAFEKAVDLIAGADSAPGTDSAASRREVLKAESRGAGGTDLENVAVKIGLDPETVVEVFGVDDGELRIVVPQSKLDSTKSGGAKQLALLLASLQQATGSAEWTKSDDIRDVASDFGSSIRPTSLLLLGRWMTCFFSRGADAALKSSSIARAGMRLESS